MDKFEALAEIQDCIEQAQELARELRGLFRDNFPEAYRQGEAYGVFDLTGSSNRYDTTLESLLLQAEEEAEEAEED